MKNNKVFSLIISLFFLLVGSSSLLNAQCNLLCNTDFDDNQITISVGIVDTSLVPCWGTTASDNKIEVWASGFNGVPSYSGNQFIELNAFFVSTLFQNFTTVPGTSVTVSFAHRGRAGTDVMGVSVGPVGGALTSLGTFTDGNTAWGYYTVGYVIPVGFGNNYTLQFNSISAAGGNPAIGNFLDAISVALPSSANLTFSSTPVSCPGYFDGTAQVSITGGSSPFIYSWAPSGGSTANAIGLSAGTYSVNVTESNGCFKTGTVSVGTLPSLTLAVSSQSVSCFGATDGTAQVSVTGGAAPYSYMWLPGALNTPTITGLASGVYTVNVSSGTVSCISSQTVFVGQGTTLNLSTTSQSTSCFGAMDGNAQVVVNGGSPPFTYTWAPMGLNTSTIGSLSAGIYTVNVSSSGCVGTKTVSVNQGASLNISVSSQSVSCLGAADGSVLANASGGAGTYSYTWMPGSANTTSVLGLSAGNYTVNAVSSNGCVGTNTVSVIPGAPLNLVVSTQNISCFGLSDGTAQITANSGIGPYTYTWSPMGLNTTNVAGLAVGVYTVQSTTANGCSETKTFSITQPSVINVSTTSFSISCSGSASGSAQVFVTGGTAPYSYSWSPSGQNTSSVVGLFPGTYSCAIHDANQCTNSVSVTISSVPSPTISVNSPTVCLGKNATLNAFGAISYTWFPGNKNGNSLQSAPLTTTTYTLVGKNQFGCTDTITTTINVNPLPLAFAGNDTTVNIDELITLVGSGSGFYGWIPFGNNPALSCNYCNQTTENPQVNTCYVLEAVNGFNCYNSDTICVSIEDDWNIYIPNTFTPNKNDINDIFIPVGYGISKIEMEIFDRWGAQIFKSADKMQGWDGTFKNKLCQTDVYVYKVVITTMTGHEEQRVGHVTLLK